MPSSRYGMSSIGMILDMTPLLPCLPAILSPDCNFLFTAIKTFTIFITPGNNSSPLCNLSTLSLNLSSRDLMTPSKCLDNFSIFFWILSSSIVINLRSFLDKSSSISAVSDSPFLTDLILEDTV